MSGGAVPRNRALGICIIAVSGIALSGISKLSSVVELITCGNVVASEAYGVLTVNVVYGIGVLDSNLPACVKSKLFNVEGSVEVPLIAGITLMAGVPAGKVVAVALDLVIVK